MDKVIILALPKSGTTILYQTLLDSMPPATVGLFEPDNCRPKKQRQLQDKNVLAKVLLHQVRGLDHYNPRACSFFDKKILIIRDPRDVLVSLFLYLFFHSTILTDFHKLTQMMSAVKAKEENPRAASFLDLIRLRDRLENNRFPLPILFTLGEMGFMMRVSQAHGRNIFHLKYEDVVDRDLNPLENHLGFSLVHTSEVDEKYERVRRTKSYGDWRNWFLPEDVDFFRPRLRDFFKRFSIPDDWDLSDDPVISSANGTEYIEGLVRKVGVYKNLDTSKGFPAGLHDMTQHGRTGEHRPFIQGLEPARLDRFQSRGARIKSLGLKTPEGEDVNVLSHGREYSVVYDLEFLESRRSVGFRVLVRPQGSRGRMMYGITPEEHPFACVEAGLNVRITLPFTCRLKPDLYCLGAMVTARDQSGFTVLHYLEDEVLFVVKQPGRELIFHRPEFEPFSAE